MAGDQLPAILPGLPKSFASFFQKPTNPNNGTSSLIKQVKFINGTPTWEYEDDEFKKLVAPHRLRLVAKFSYGRPKMEEVHKEFRKIGFNGGYTLGLMNPRLLNANAEVETGFCFEEDPSVVPVWVSLFDLSIQYMHLEIGHKEIDCRDETSLPTKDVAEEVVQATKKKAQIQKSVPLPQTSKFAILQDIDDAGNEVKSLNGNDKDNSLEDNDDDTENIFTEGNNDRQLGLLDTGDGNNLENEGQSKTLFYPDDSFSSEQIDTYEDDDYNHDRSWSDGEKDAADLVENTQGELSIKNKRSRKSKEESAKLLEGKELR
ncbi:OLC1v1024640C1 [Oldenlandia corymbosa var. corymbosa]|uniref:OLC1v1024640C1 n=1 Tax=Oldenlandia corymbosa var. corymbosa TaxID=529605 RepID=A0AAV1C343_OLDCO|nr:OLC1v1024640C1 [Oldenlandia corymbosa var. corymbosa]